MTLFTRTLVALTLFVAVVSPAAAYIGPGAGLSLLGALWGLLAAVGAALLFVVTWPFRRMLRRKRASTQTSADSTETDDDTSSQTHTR